MKLVFKLLLFCILTVLTQIGGVAFLVSEVIGKKWPQKRRLRRIFVFVFVYFVFTFLVVPFLAPKFGREKVRHYANAIVGFLPDCRFPIGWWGAC